MRPHRASVPVILVATQGAVSGGEVMLLNTAKALREVGTRPIVVAPSIPEDLLVRAKAEGFEVHPYDVRHRSALLRAWMLRRTVRGIQSSIGPTVVWCHGLKPSFSLMGFRNKISHLHRLPEGIHRIPSAIVWLTSREFFVVSKATRAALPKWQQNKATVLSNWTAPLDLRENENFRGKRPLRIGYLGRMVSEKGIEDLVLAVQQIRRQEHWKDVELHVGGDTLFATPKGRQTILDTLEQTDVPIIRHGWVDAAAFAQEIDVLVCPSRWEESFGLVAAEAMALGVPLVISNAGALPEVAGYSYRYTAQKKDASDLARVIGLALRELETEVGRKIVTSARQRWEKLWSPAAGKKRVREVADRWIGIMS